MRQGKRNPLFLIFGRRIVPLGLGLDFWAILYESARGVWKAGQDGGDGRQKNARPPKGGPAREGEEEVVLDWM